MPTKKGTAAPKKSANKPPVKKAAVKQTSKPAGNRRMNASEAIINFFGVLTTRKEPLIFSSAHDCAPIAEIANEFIKVNKLPAVRDDFPVSKPLPDSVAHLTNVPNNAQACCKLSAEETFRNVVTAIRQHNNGEQNEIVANILLELERSRVGAVNGVNHDMEQLKIKAFEVNHDLEGFKAIREGGYEKLAFTKYTGVK